MMGDLFTARTSQAAKDLLGANPIVVLAPHPDDETLGCGGLLATAFQTAGAHVVCMTDGSASHPGSVQWPSDRLAILRDQELVEAIERLGGREGDMTWLGYPDGELRNYDPHPIAERIATICRELGADRLFSASPVDHHADHKATADIARRVAALCPSLRLFFYPVWARWDEPDFKALHGDWPLVHFETARHCQRKADALNAHQSQLGQVVLDAPSGFCLEQEMIRRFCEEDEIYFEVQQCP